MSQLLPAMMSGFEVPINRGVPTALIRILSGGQARHAALVHLRRSNSPRGPLQKLVKLDEKRWTAVAKNLSKKPSGTTFISLLVESALIKLIHTSNYRQNIADLL
jgi:hypothetical protein